MGKVREDLTGRTFGRLTVIERAEDYITPKGRHCVRWLCECSCADKNMVIVRAVHLKDGLTQSCGCLSKEKTYEMRKKYNTYDLSGEYGIGWTFNTNREFYFDLEDYNRIKDFCWCENVAKSGFSKLVAHTQDGVVSMHVALGFKFYDHIDRNQLNNRKCNLRKATHKENTRNRTKTRRNTSGFVGVTLNKNSQKWRAIIVVNSKTISLGEYHNKDDAVKARLKAEAAYFGEFAPQIHLFEQYGIAQQND